MNKMTKINNLKSPVNFYAFCHYEEIIIKLRVAIVLTQQHCDLT